MTVHARAVVIGGGIVGCGVLLQLARLGWTDAALIEKGELTSGSTWHAAGNVPVYSESLFNARIQKESFAFFRDLEERLGLPCGVHACGGLRIARSEEELREYRRFLAIARLAGIEAEIVDAKRAIEIWPLIKPEGIVGALHTPGDGYTDPAQSTNAAAKAARDLGARIYRHTRVLGLKQRPDRGWTVETDKGEFVSEVVVNCAGFHASEISAMAGAYLPVVSFEHQYMITEDAPELKGLGRELPVLRDMNVPLYLRQERTGLMVGLFEDETVFWGLDGIPPNFDTELLPSNLERVTRQLERTMEVIPVLNDLGVKTVVNGPTNRGPEHRPLVGPAHGLRGYYVFGGSPGGFVWSGATRYLAEWIVEGEPGIDLSPIDPRRFGRFADQRYTVARLSENHLYSAPVTYPHAEATGGRPARLSPLYERLKSEGAVFGSRNGWEIANWFARPGELARDRPCFGRPNWFDAVRAECLALAEGVGIFDATAQAKFELRGEGAAALIGRLAGAAAPPSMRACFASLRTRKGHIAMLGLVACRAPDDLLIASEPECEERDADWLGAQAAGAGLELRNVTDSRGLLLLAGAKADLLLRDLGAVLSAEGPDIQALDIEAVGAGGARLEAVRVQGPLGAAWMLFHERQDQVAIYDALMRRGERYGIRPFGQRAYEWLRIDHAWPRHGIDCGIDTTPEEAGPLPEGAAPAGRRLALLQVADPQGLDLFPWGGEPVVDDGREIGVVTSAGFSPRLDGIVVLARLFDEAPDRLSDRASITYLGQSFPAALAQPARR